MELKVGEIFEYKGVTLKIIECEDCNGCYFQGNIVGCRTKEGFCSSSYRSDKTSIILKKVDFNFGRKF